MKKGYTDITVVLDESGSMNSIRGDTIGGFNAFLKAQKEAVGEATISLVKFSGNVLPVYVGQNVKEVANLSEATFVPMGGTALLDAIGNSIISAGKRISDMKEEDRPENVIFVIQTDGEENQSREFTREKINEMIKHQTEKYNWDFVFLGANQDAIQSGRSLGVMAGNAMSFAANSQGSGAMYDSIAVSMTSYRGGDLSKKTAFFSDADRLAQTNAGA